MSEISEVIASEIADFFADFGGPGEPDIQSGEAQRLLTERLLSVMALRERAEPVAYISKADLDAGYPHILARKEYSKACPMAVYSAPPAPVVPDELVYKLLDIAKRAAEEADECANAEFSDNSMKHAREIAEWERRAAMLNQVQPVAETDTTSQQYGSLAKDGE
ncbi:hypothetical protein CVY58_RS06150 [Cronobacter sakazakii]|uniref:hypothetical protein n=1 Tax=Cronobacter sakazakii TaxID=28141 RepID=UPI000978BE6C|nr:hypothetical protein [Cronobacter sakazakii]EGT4300214.1 hypothetical protein [Cronobacter sakazakii]EGT4342581.1 hypothetical protein [Cronobacter sakazakii]EJG0602353.1 hypothetical protein [Cronobacter sakazakii]EJG0606231.1 hypothetical protein [Cronobacter sakazakii]EJG0610675.1 hypothetical protein [Cronobacter sakazakii]